MTTPKRSRKTGATTPKPRTASRTRARKAKSAEPAAVRPDPPEVIEPDAPIVDAVVEPPVEAVIVTSPPEPGFVAHVPPPEPPPARPPHRRCVFFDVENTSRAADIARVLQHLALDWECWGTQFMAVGNWRVIGHDTARLLAQHGAALVHSAPSVGVRDWSDLRIAVSAGVWLAGARPGDIVEIVSDDQAFDAVGDVAASLGVTFRRTSYRALAGGSTAERQVAATEPRPRRSRRSGRRGRDERSERRPPQPARTPAAAVAPDAEPHTAPHDEIVGVVRDLLATSPGGVNLDALANELRARGFSRPPGSPRLITRLRRIKELDVGRNGTIRLLENGAGATPTAEQVADAEAAGPSGEVTDEDAAAAEPGPAEAAPRRRRRRGGRRRRGRRNGAAAAEAPGSA